MIRYVSIFVMLFVIAPNAMAFTIHFYAARGDVERVKEYLERGGDPNARSPVTGRTPLMDAAKNGTSVRHVRVIEELLKRDADVNLRSRLDYNALYWSLQPDILPEVSESLLKAGARIDHKMMAPGDSIMWPLVEWIAYHNRLDIVDRILEADTDINTRDSHTGGTILLYAARYNRHEMARKLVDNGAKIDIEDYEHRNPRLEAMLYKAKKVGDILG